MHIDSTAAELVVIARMLRRLGALRHHLDYDEILRVADLLRDCADALDHGAADLRGGAPPLDAALRPPVAADPPAGALSSAADEALPDPGLVMVRIRHRKPRPRPPIRPATRRP